MKKIYFLILLIISFQLALAQALLIDGNLRTKIFQQKALHYQQLRAVEEQQTANQNDYDVTYYELNLTPDTTTSILYGEVTVRGEVTAPNLNFVELNFWDGMIITSIYHASAPGVQLSYNRNNDILTVILGSTYLQGEIFNITIEYYGQPQNSGYWGFEFDSYDGKSMIWTFSQPWGARSWWPCKDIPSDKADSMDIWVTVPGNLIVASNGSLKQTTIAGNQATYWWHENYPIATYLVSLAIYPYEVHFDDYLYNNNTDTMKIHFYTFPGNFNQYYSLNENIKYMITFFARLFGEYPFVDEKYGHADFSFPYGAIEHQTCASLAVFTEWLYVHELAHQWWGDMITYNSWHHTWLAEGLAVYSEALWYEHLNSPGKASEYQLCNNLYYGPGTVYVEDPGNENPFDINLVYQKASWVFHMLRHVVGNDTFFDILENFHYSPQHQYGTATTEEFRAICEQVSGVELDKFFQQWIYEEYFPKYSYSWQAGQNGPNYDIYLEIVQQQSGPLFWMPIDIYVNTADHDTTFVVWDSLQSQNFQLTVSSEPLYVELDRDNWILKQVEDSIINPAFDQGILLVNGVSFTVYGSEIWDAYQNEAFWGDYSISFWDCFISPPGGYPSTLPTPLGHGKIPEKILGKYSTVIWVGNNYGGDINSWITTPVLQYLQAGGNLILMTRMGQDFIDEEMRQYLGITWAENTTNTINNCISSYTGLLNMPLNGSQTSNAVFETNLSSNESTLLFQETVSFSVARGLGVCRNPAGGGAYRSDGGKFVFISGRPYRYESSQLRENIEFILENIFNEPPSALNNNSNNHLIKDFCLEQNFPNPFNPVTTIEFDLPKSSDVTLKIFNILGEEVATLVSDRLSAGSYLFEWDASNLSSGVYLYRLQAGDYIETRKMVLMK